MRTAIARFVRLTPAERSLLVEATATLAVTALAVAMLPFRRVVALARRPDGAPPGEAERLRQVAAVRWAVAACARRVPWRAKCLEQGFAAQWMLRRRAVPAVVHYGVARAGGGLQAHAWVRAGTDDVIGCENLADFAEVAQFPPRA
ncbi:MAG TPA: lasso peptide biosynthesis B2 protein [Croceibacterium sp.]|nr:lasso peptide biosynthesis B2 protein [Croceibacterium sp.]